jgi:aminopeptidase N
VTCESWSNITLNESFADFSETLWNEYKYGKDAGDAVNYAGIQTYLQQPENAEKDLVRFHYADKEDVFDQVSYPKGGRILNMLRNYVGDSAFWKSLNLYLNTYKFKSAEAQELRLAFEEVTGEDLNWYWNQWYYGAGHPKLTIDYVYDDAAGKVQVIVNQTQEGGKVFRLPVAIDVYNGAAKTRHQVWVEDKTDTFTFSYASHPGLVNFDGDKILLCEKTDNKTLDNFIHQFKYAGLYLDRREAIDFCSKYPDDPKAIELMKAGLKDRFYKIRNYTLTKLDFNNDTVRTAFEPLIAEMAVHDPNRIVEATAIGLLGSLKKPEYETLFTKATNDSSYTVAGNALEALLGIDSVAALKITKELQKAPAKGELSTAISIVLIKAGDENDFDAITNTFDKMPVTESKLDFLAPYITLLSKVKSTDRLKHGVDVVIKFKEAIPSAYRGQTDPYFDAGLNSLVKKKTADGMQDQADYIKGALAAEKK